MSRLAIVLCLSLTSCLLAPVIGPSGAARVESVLLVNDRAAFQPRDNPRVLMCVVENNDVGARVAEVFQKCGNTVSQRLLAADLELPGYDSQLLKGYRIDSLGPGELPPLNQLVYARNDWERAVIGHLRDEDKRFANVDWLVTVRLACGTVPIPANKDRGQPYNAGPRVAQLDVVAIDARDATRAFTYRGTFHAPYGYKMLGKQCDYGPHEALREECMAPLVDDFMKKLSEATPKR